MEEGRMRMVGGRHHGGSLVVVTPFVFKHCTAEALPWQVPQMSITIVCTYSFLPLEGLFMRIPSAQQDSYQFPHPAVLQGQHRCSWPWMWWPKSAHACFRATILSCLNTAIQCVRPLIMTAFHELRQVEILGASWPSLCPLQGTWAEWRKE